MFGNLVLAEDYKLLRRCMLWIMIGLMAVVTLGELVVQYVRFTSASSIGSNLINPEQQALLQQTEAAITWPAPNGATSGVWSALDAATGATLWETRPPDGGSTSGPVTTANGVVFGCSLDAQGHMYALNAVTGEVLWSFASGGSCLSGAAISNGNIFWGSGYSNFGFGTSNNKLYAFGLP